MDTSQLIDYLQQNINTFDEVVDLGGGTKVSNSRAFLQTHLETVSDPSTTSHIREVHLLRLQRFYDAIVNKFSADVPE